MLVPRRVRRRLLLPPGWVALGFLLLLGCQALQPWVSQLKQWNAIQLTMPPLKIDISYGRFLKKQPEYASEQEYNPYTTSWSVGAASMLRKMRPWHDTEFSGNSLLDFLQANATEAAIRKIIADTSHAGGVRVRLLPGATYANLVNVLDIMLRTNQKKNWLDIRHEPVTFYAITDKIVPADTTPIWVCGYVAREPLPTKSSFGQLAAETEQEISSLKNQAWRLPMLLLLAVSSWSLWQVSQRLFTCRSFQFTRS